MLLTGWARWLAATLSPEVWSASVVKEAPTVLKYVPNRPWSSFWLLHEQVKLSLSVPNSHQPRHLCSIKTNRRRRQSQQRDITATFVKGCFDTNRTAKIGEMLITMATIVFFWQRGGSHRTAFPWISERHGESGTAGWVRARSPRLKLGRGSLHSGLFDTAVTSR